MVKIRLARRGRKKLAMYDVVVADARAPRDGRFIEKIGTYNPLTVPASIVLNDDKAFQWLMNGAQPSDTVKAMLSYRGVMLKKHLQIGVIKGALTQEQADAKLDEWLKEKEAKIGAKRDKATQSKEATAKERKAAETKIKEARAEAIRKKAEVAAEAAAAPPPEEVTAPAPEGEAPKTAESVEPKAAESAEPMAAKSEEPKAAASEEPKAAASEEPKNEAPSPEAPAVEPTEQG